MRSSTPVTHEEQLKTDLQAAKKAAKKARAAYKAKMKELKSKIKPLKQALKEAEKAHKAAKAAYKAATTTSETETQTAPKRRGRQPGFSPKAAKPVAPAKNRTTTSDDLTQVKGVGENISVMLKANGITTYADMAATSFDRYKELLKANGMSKFRDPSQWAARAAELANTPATAEAPAAPRKRGRQPGFSPKAAKAAKQIAKSRISMPTLQRKGSASGDDLTQVKGVGENISVMLKANGITTYSDMAATSFDRYKELLKANGMSKFRDPSQWAARAAELANTPTAAEAPAAPRKRGRQPGFSPKAAKGVWNHEEQKAPKRKAAAGGDDLTQVKGVGDNIAVMLKANGITTYAAMAGTSFERYKELLKANGMSKFRDPSQWAARAAEIANLPAPPKSAPKASEPAAAPRKRGRQPGYSPKAAKGVVNHEEQKAPKRKAAAGGDDLTQVKGVGDNIAVMLRANGITTYAAMAGTSFERYKELLKANGMSKFRDPSQWAARAAELANLPAPPKAPAKAAEPAAAPRKRGRQPGYSPKAAKAAAKAPAAKAAPAKAPAKPKSPPAKPDDLTQVKGVGQRVAEALNKDGIYTFKDMASVSLERYKEILKENNMSKFRDPSDWARLAGELAGKK